MGILTKLKRIKAGVRLIKQQYIAPFDTSKYGKVGKHSIIKSNSTLIKQNIYVDDYCLIQDQLNFITNKGKLFLGKYSVIASDCTIIPDSHIFNVGVPFYMAATKNFNDTANDVVIEEDCSIGAKCIILSGCHINRGAVVGAGCVVKKDVPPYAVVVGVPARIVATRFTKEQIMKHETILYKPIERMSKEEIDVLFENEYKGLKSIGHNELTGELAKELNIMKDNLGIVDYSKEL